jgi:glyoxalase family protein
MSAYPLSMRQRPLKRRHHVLLSFLSVWAAQPRGGQDYMELHGLHHVTAVTGQVRANLEFYTKVLGLQLVKKTVNQDDVSAYHLFYADKLGTPGTDMTFFDWPQIGPNQRGTDSIVNTMFRVNGRAALDYWTGRFDASQIKHEAIAEFAGRAMLHFEDPEGQRLTLVDDGGAPFEGQPWDGSDVPIVYALRGFYGVTLSIPTFKQIEPILTQLLGFKRLMHYPDEENPTKTICVYSMEDGGPGKEIHVVEEPLQPRADLGSGGVHHVAFRVKDDDEQHAWEERFNHVGMPTSGIIDRFYFHSLYFRISSGILFELATDGPGFAADEPADALGKRLALPPFLEPHRAQIEAGLKPI